MRSDLDEMDKIFHSKDLSFLLDRVLQSKKVAEILQKAVLERGIRFDIRRTCLIDCDQNGFIISAKTPTIASKLKQLQPSLEKALFVNGIHTPIVAIRASQYTPIVIDQNPPALGPVRQGDQQTSDAIHQTALKARDEDVKASLERLSKATRP